MKHKFKALYLFCGIGGGALGFQGAKEEYKGTEGSIETICGIDCDPEICQDFEYITGSRAKCMDLFSREQYIKFHKERPPEDWQEVNSSDIKNACKGEYPDIVFTSPPCKGFSGLLPAKSAASEKYQALNKLTIRGIRLVCEAFRDNLPSLILLENVPRITTRGRKLIDKIKEVLNEYGYAFTDGFHDCGEIGGLAQHRKRYLLICRHTKKLQGFVYEPPIQRVKTIGEVLGKLPLPDDVNMGAMHRIPKLAWKTWLRLALIPAGGDWRNLQNIDVEKCRLEYCERNNIYRVLEWSNTTKIVHENINENKYSKNRHTSHFKIVPWDETSGTITGASHVANGLISVQDVRFRKPQRAGTMEVMKWNEASKTITSAGVYSGSAAFADPRIPKDTEKGTWIIISKDNTRHRPLTTLELAVLQGLPMYIDGKPLKLAGKNDSKWRERIGNMVPVGAAQAIAQTMLRALLPQLKSEIVLGWTPIWVVPVNV